MPARTTPTARPLPSDVDEVIRRLGGMAHQSQLVAAGITPSRISRLRSRSSLMRVAKGCYVGLQHYLDADPWVRFTLQSRALARASGPDVHLAGWSAATAAWSMPTVGPAPDRPEAVRARIDRRGAVTNAFGRVRSVHVPDEHLTIVGDSADEPIVATSMAWTVIDLSRRLPVPHGLVLADHAARHGVDLTAALPAFAGWPGVDRARWVVAEARPNCETPLETHGRIPIYLMNLPMPVFNAWVGIDAPKYRVDALWPWHGVVAEADGAIKYNNRPDANSIVRRQYEREWDLQRLGLVIVRYGWDLAARRPLELGSRFATVLAERTLRDEPVRWWYDDHGVPREVEARDQSSPHPCRVMLPAGWDQPRGRT